MRPWVWIDGESVRVGAGPVELTLALEMESCLPPATLEPGLTYSPVNSRMLCARPAL